VIKITLDIYGNSVHIFGAYDYEVGLISEDKLLGKVAFFRKALSG
jgi:hypothetical protein